MKVKGWGSGSGRVCVCGGGGGGGGGVGDRGIITQETAYPTISGFQYIVIGWGQGRWKDA